MRRIVSAKIKFISLVPRGANQLPVIYKSDDDTVNFTSLTKAMDKFDEKGELLSVVYAPEMVDSQGDIASEETIKEMMYNAAKDGYDVDIRHDGKALAKEEAYIAESFIIQKGDPRFAEFENYKGEKVDVTGGWATVIKIENQDLRKAYREGKWNGVSMAGDGVFAAEKQDQDGVRKFLDLLKDSLKNKPDSGDLNMDKSELTEILTKNNETLATAITEGITKALKPDGETKGGSGDGKAVEKAECPVAKPTLKDATDLKQVEKYQKELVAYKAAQSVDWEDPESIAEYQKAMATEQEADPSDADAGIEKEDSDEVKTLKKQLAKAQMASNAGEEKPKPAAAGSINISKADEDLLRQGQAAGQAHNKNRGY